MYRTDERFSNPCPSREDIPWEWKKVMNLNWGPDRSSERVPHPGIIQRRWCPMVFANVGFLAWCVDLVPVGTFPPPRSGSIICEWSWGCKAGEVLNWLLTGSGLHGFLGRERCHIQIQTSFFLKKSKKIDHYSSVFWGGGVAGGVYFLRTHKERKPRWKAGSLAALFVFLCVIRGESS